MPRWVWIWVIGTLGVCAICGAFVAIGREIRADYLHGREAVSEQMAETIATSVTGSIAATKGSRTEIVLAEADFNVNNAFAVGDPGIRWGTDGTLIYGLATGFSGRGITLYMGNEAIYSGIPTVIDGRIDLIEIVSSSSALHVLLTESGFERAMENGINQALSDAGLVPVALIIGKGVLAISTAARSQAPTWVDSNSRVG